MLKGVNASLSLDFLTLDFLDLFRLVSDFFKIGVLLSDKLQPINSISDRPIEGDCQLS